MKKLFKSSILLLALAIVLPAPIANGGVPDYPPLDQFKIEITPYSLVWDLTDCLPGEEPVDCGYAEPDFDTPVEIGHEDTLSIDLFKNFQFSLVAPATTHPDCQLRYGIEDLYFVSPLDNSSRSPLEFDDWADGRVLQGAGTYEADIIAYCIPDLSLAPDTIWNRIQNTLLPKALAHWFTYDQVGTIRFNVTDATSQPGCCSSVVFLPGIKGSVLERTNLLGQRDVLWPPSLNPTGFSNDMDELALDADGKSINDVKVSGLIETFYGVSVYDGFANFADGLVSDGTINEWKAFPYDWRLSIADTIDGGVKNSDGSITDWVAEIERLAEQSKSGKVALVAHSMGGLMGKALIKKLEEQGKAGLVESFTMVGTPQLGTPQTIASMLHGDDEGIPGGFVATIGLDFIVPASEARALSLNMPSAYNLLPSSKYFDEVAEPVALFTDTSFTSSWRGCWGDTLDSYDELTQFLVAECADRDVPSASQLRLPAVANGLLVDQSISEHSELDNYVFPDSIRVIQVAGWGLETVESIEYRTRHFLQSYEVLFNREGDKVVVYPSAIANPNEEIYYFNIFNFNDFENSNIKHRDLLNAQPVRQLLAEVVKNTPSLTVKYVSTSKPSIDNLTNQLKLSTHSPVILGAYDEYGNFTGINPEQDLSSELPIISEEIPGSAFVVFGDSQHIFLPEGGKYKFVYNGTGYGSTTVEVDIMQGNTVKPVASFSNIITSPDTEAVIEVENLEDNLVVQLDNDGDGTVDQMVSPDIVEEVQEQSLNELLENLRAKIDSLNITAKLKKRLIKKVNSLEKKLDKKRVRNQLRLDRLDTRLDTLVTKGKLLEDDLTEIEELLSELENHDILLLNKETITGLSSAIDFLPVKEKVKKSLQKKVAVLLRKQALMQALDSFIKLIGLRGSKGKLTNEEVEELTDLIKQIQNVI